MERRVTTQKFVTAKKIYFFRRGGVGSIERGQISSENAYT
jgi:hypothetical protein